LGERLKGKRMLFNEKGFCKEKFVLKTVPNMEKRGKDKPSEGSKCCMKGSE
jgi:hypothetical protein